MINALWFLLACMLIGGFAFVYVHCLYGKIMSKPMGNLRMQEISEAIRTGSKAFLKKEYEILAVFVIAVALIMIFLLDDKATLLNEGMGTAVSFVLGGLCSILAGFIGMNVSTRANARTTEAARRTGLAAALDIAFSSGSIMGLTVVAIGAIGLSFLILLFSGMLEYELGFVIRVIAGFGLGASSIALFARVGGGIFTKAADIGADLVGKVERGIPEDDPRNPAVIADNVGDNVGDVAGMGADLFESYVGSIIAAITIGYALYSTSGIALPVGIAALGIVASLIGSMYVRMKRKKGGVGEHPAQLMKYGLIVTTGLTLFFTFLLTMFMFPNDFLAQYIPNAVGLLIGVGIGIITDYYTSGDNKPVRRLAKSSTKGTAPLIIEGLSLGYMSTLWPVLMICAGILVSYWSGGLYGIAISAVGMLSTLGYSLATDAYGPVADNAGGIAEMARLPKRVRRITDKLDAAGNTTAAIGKGFAIGSAALTALALFSAYMSAGNLSLIDIARPRVIVGLFLGGLLPFVFSALTMDAVGKAAMQIVSEVRRQFRQTCGNIDIVGRGEHSKCISIATSASLRGMIVPGIMAVITPILIGLFLGKEAVGGLIAGSIVMGTMLAISMANSGGAWDNAKKYIEQGHYGGKGSEAHKASVVGDNLGDPFKDTSGPSMNILIKLMSIVALVFVGIFI